jgi:hypothetical protein
VGSERSIDRSAVPSSGDLHRRDDIAWIGTDALSPEEQEVVRERRAQLGLVAPAAGVQPHGPELQRGKGLDGGQAGRRTIGSEFLPALVPVQPFAFDLTPADPAVHTLIGQTPLSRILGRGRRRERSLRPRVATSKLGTHPEYTCSGLRTMRAARPGRNEQAWRLRRQATAATKMVPPEKTRSAWAANGKISRWSPMTPPAPPEMIVRAERRSPR